MADADETSTASGLRKEDSVHPSRLDATDQLLVFQRWFKDDSRHSSKWRGQAREDFAFVVGDQWSSEDQQLLKNQMRPAIVFNRALTIIKCVAGMEINSRHEINFLPRNTDDAKSSELLTGASKWMADECDGEDEESTSFQHTNICGLGVLEHRLGYDDDPSGLYIEEAIDPLEYYWDCRAKKKNLMDRRRDWRARKIPVGDALEMFPDHSISDLDASWAQISDSPEPAKTLEERRVRDENVTASWGDKDEVTILCLQWYEKEPYWKLADPATNSTCELTNEQYQTLTKRLKVLGMGDLPAVKLQRKVYRQAFIGNVVLKVMPAPIPDRFSRTPMTGELEHNKGTFFGLVRVMRDPQMWSNKWLSQSLHILNTTAKGGILAERDAFEDQAQAEESYAQPQSITWANKGAVKDGKIMAKPGGAFPQGHMQLMELAITALRDVTGINYELLGLKDVNQPGILEAQRKQAGMTVLATMFDSLRRMRKEVGRIRLYYIQNFLSDGRLIRIVGQDGAKAIPLIRDKCVGVYDVVVDDAPTSPNQKDANWNIILSILPAFKDQLMQRPDLLTLIMEYSPLPQRLVDALKAALQQPTNPQAARTQQLAEEKIVSEINKNQSTAEMQNAKAGATQATALYDVAMARNLLTKSDHQIEGIKALAEVAHKSAQVRTENEKAANVAADTAAKHAGVHATHASAAKDRVEAVRQAFEPIPEHEDAFPKPAPVGSKR